MHPRSLAEREAAALKSLTASVKKLAKQMGQPELAEAITSAKHNDPQIQSMRRTEALAQFMEAVSGTSKQDGAKSLRASILAASDDDLVSIPGIGEKSLASIREWASTEPEQPPVTVETVTEEPLKTTEVVETVPSEQVNLESPTTTKSASGKKGKPAADGGVQPVNWNS